ncbi:hypothetical protein GCM10027416_08280 [Okibacterium endophyticum]
MNNVSLPTTARASTRAEWAALCRADWAANRGYPKSRVVLMLFRSAQYWRSKRGVGRLGHLIVGSFYKVISEWMLGIEIPASTRVGPGLRLRHGVGVVVNPHAVIGAGVMLRQGVTIGNRRENDDCPVIEDGVELGAGAVVVGSVRVGRGSRVAPNVVLMQDLPPNSVALPAPVVVKARRSPDAPSSRRPALSER